jgi:hypothetical protein
MSVTRFGYNSEEKPLDGCGAGNKRERRSGTRFILIYSIIHMRYMMSLL